MASRSIAIRITIDNRDAINAARAQVIAMEGLNNETAKHTHLQNGLTNSFIKGNLAARAISAAYVGLRDSLQFAVGGAIEFEHTLTKISAITGTTGGQLSSLEATIRGVAVSTNLSQTELAKTALEMGKIGLSGKQVEDALGSVAQLARALDEDMVRTGETVVAILNVYGIAASEAGRVTDGLAHTVKASALDIETFGTAFSYVGGTAAAAGVGLHELQGAMAVLSNAGIRSSTIGTQLRRIIADLSSETSKAGKVLGGTAIKDYASFADTLDALAAKQLTISDYTAIFGRTASSVVSVLVKYRNSMREVGQETLDAEGETKVMSDTMNSTLKSAIDGVRVAWADFGIEIMKSDGFLKSFLGNMKLAIETINERNKLQNQLKAFEQERPAEYFRAEQSLGNMGRLKASFSGVAKQDLMSGTPQFQKFLNDTWFKQYKEKTKANIVEEVLATLNTDVAKELVKGLEDNSSQIPVAEAMKGRFAVLARMFGKSSEEFMNDPAVRKAQLKLAQSLEPRETESKVAGKGGKKSKASPDFDPFDVFDRLQDMDEDGTTYKEKHDAKRDKERDKAEKRAMKSMEDVAKKIGMVSSKKEYEEWLQRQTVALQGLHIAQEGVNESIGIFSHFLAEGLLSDKKDPFKGISDAFGNFIKKMISDLIAATIKLLVFKAVLASFGGGAGPGGFFSTAFNPTGNGGQDFILKSLGGTKFASGTDQYVDRPTAFIAGESGRERVTVTPRSKVGQGGSGGLTVVVQGNVYGGEQFEAAVEKAQKSLKKNRL